MLSALSLVTDLVRNKIVSQWLWNMPEDQSGVALTRHKRPSRRKTQLKSDLIGVDCVGYHPCCGVLVAFKQCGYGADVALHLQPTLFEDGNLVVFTCQASRIFITEH